MRGGPLRINWHDLKPVLTLDFHPVSRRLATGGEDHYIKIWVLPPDSAEKLPTACYQDRLSFHVSAVNVLRFSPNGKNLVSGAHDGCIIVWKLHSTGDGEAWKVQKSIWFHYSDILDLQWSSDNSFFVSSSADNRVIIWDANKGERQQMLKGHLHCIDGLAWDPLGQYIASISSDRICKIYANKPQDKSKNIANVNFVCQHTLAKAELHIVDETKPPVKTHLFHDEVLPSFLRRLAWSPDGSFLLLPAGPSKYQSEEISTAVLISRKDLTRPVKQLPVSSKDIVAVRFCPIVFTLRGSQSDGIFTLPYRAIFAVASLNSLYVYDTESVTPIVIHDDLHNAAITDIAWSSDAKYLAVSSGDGYCTILEFENEELGQPHILSDNMEHEYKRARERWTWRRQVLENGLEALLPVSKQSPDCCVMFSMKLILDSNIRIKKGRCKALSLDHLQEQYIKAKRKIPNKTGVMRLLMLLMVEGIFTEEDHKLVHKGLLPGGSQYKLKTYTTYNVRNIDDIRRALYRLRNGGPLLAVIRISKNYDVCCRAGDVYKYDREQDLRETHAIAVIAFSIEEGPFFECQDSQGIDFGDKGYIKVDVTSIKELYALRIQ